MKPQPFPITSIPENMRTYVSENTSLYSIYLSSIYLFQPCLRLKYFAIVINAHRPESFSYFFHPAEQQGTTGRSIRNSNPVMISSAGGAKGCSDHIFCASPAYTCLLYTSPSPRDRQKSRMPSSA